MKNAEQWRRETDVVFDDEVADDDDQQESWEIGQLFEVGGVSEVDDRE